MKRWISPDRTWPAGVASWQVYVLPDFEVDDELEELLDAYAEVVRDPSWACLSPAALADLHVTVQPLAGWAHDRADADIAAVREALTARLAGLAPIPATAGPALAGSSGVLLDLVDARDRWGCSLEGLWRQVQAGITEALGAQALGRSGWPPHLTLAYASAERDSGEVQSALRRIRPGRAPWDIRAVHLCRVHQDADHDRYTWDQQLTIPLGGG